eukprot:SAG22_NODE_250_length_13779_cov_6.413450_9_plen_239_part_00
MCRALSVDHCGRARCERVEPAPLAGGGGPDGEPDAADEQGQRDRLGQRSHRARGCHGGTGGSAAARVLPHLLEPRLKRLLSPFLLLRRRGRHLLAECRQPVGGGALVLLQLVGGTARVVLHLVSDGALVLLQLVAERRRRLLCGPAVGRRPPGTPVGGGRGHERDRRGGGGGRRDRPHGGGWGSVASGWKKVRRSPLLKVCPPSRPARSLPPPSCTLLLRTGRAARGDVGFELTTLEF